MSSDPFSLTGKRALVIGGTRGIGRAIALEFAAAGASTLATYVRSQAAADETLAAARAAGAPLEVLRADQTSDKGREALAAALEERYPTLDCIVYAAATGVHKPFDKLTARHFDWTFDLNVKSFLLLVQACAPRLADGASIVALSSEGAERALLDYDLVGASKGALEALCRHLAAELGPRGVRVNVLSPGSVATDAWKVLPNAEARLAAGAERAPLRRITSLEDVAHAARFLASRASAGITGHTLVVDAGARIVASA